MIVDDKLENIRLLSDFLSTQQYQIRKAINGRAALTAVKTIPPDLILLDINMPGISGYEVCEQLKSDSKTSSIPVIFLSAGDDLANKVRAFQVGAVDYITKPFQLEEVLIRVQTQLTLCKLQRSLEEKNAKLNQALDSLKAAQIALVQKEKTATLRKVVAGVAHEINNPLSFIACNIEPIRQYKNQLLNLISLYQQKFPEVDSAIANLQKEIDLDFLASDIDKITNSMKHGTERISTVILALRIFTRLDESDIKQINVHECIDSILTLFHHRLNSNHRKSIEIQKEFEELPLITCYAEQFNQAIFNLVCNAIDAVEVKLDQTTDSSYHPQISIQTQVVNNQLAVKIKDNGIGIAEENQPRLFEPFFTTKSAGNGIGLSLATSQRIIEEVHGGSLTYSSIADVGTEFTIRLPILEI
ncbi:response regulator [Microcoleus sp. FACHB-1515]|uniref:sensor histidine kinase n=1 Tax=Cyanophyceae TaxID=3028117 RepID=UPI001F54D513|nr:response regulator [Microcoleus sp. FACHB-1515]